VNYQLVTSANRIPLMANGTIDLECGSTTNNIERQKQVWFTNTHFITANRWVGEEVGEPQLARRPQGQDDRLDGGHDNIKQMTELNTAPEPRHEHHLRPTATPEAVPDGRDGPRGRLRDGRHPALQPRGAVAQPGRVGDLEGRDLGRALRDHASQDDVRSRRSSTRAPRTSTSRARSTRSTTSGSKARPPKGINLNVPMGDALKKAFANPTDSGDPAAYK
jgi:glutamate/aspartate transport system substrate-binding protein